MEDAVYHVLLEGRRVGPYDRRTIVGMRIKKALASADLLVAADGRQLTVGDLVRQPHADPNFQPSRSGSYSVVQGIYNASLAEVQGRGLEIPNFKGEVELRVQTKVLRLEGWVRERLATKQDRIKIPLDQVAHARLRGSLVDLGLRAAPDAPLQRVTLELFTPEAAAEFGALLPNVAAWPPEPARPPGASAPRAPHPLVWGAVVGTALLVAGVMVWVLTRRAGI